MNKFEYEKYVRKGKEFIFVSTSHELKEGNGKQIQISEDIDHQVALFRVEGKLYCLYNICPHRHADQIFNGLIKDGNVTCPLHGWTYRLLDGQNINKLQGIKSLECYEIFEENNKIYIEYPPLKIPKWRNIEEN